MKRIRTLFVALGCFQFSFLTDVQSAVADVDKEKSKQAVESLQAFLKPDADLEKLKKQTFASVPLTKQDAEEAKKSLWQDHVRRIEKERRAELEKNEFKVGEHSLKIWHKTYGEKPATGRSLWISLHGGGGAPARVNDSQWNNQKRLYKPAEGIYVAPRAPGNTWDLWHRPHVDQLFDRMIETFVALKDVDPNRVYVMGYSAGGDGVYQLAPRMADRWAAAAMMAGHPNDAKPLGLRNIGFALFMGGKDGAYKRNQVAKEWQGKLADLQKQDNDGYRHFVKIYPNKGHWMGGLDREALPWMANIGRNPLPKRIVWQQDDVLRNRFYWLATTNPKKRQLVTADLTNNRIDLNCEPGSQLNVRLNDQMTNLDLPVSVAVNKKESRKHSVSRTIGMLSKTIEEYGDPALVFSSEISVGAK